MAFRPLGTADDAPQEDEKSFKEQLMSLIDISLFKSSVFILLIAMAIFATFGELSTRVHLAAISENPDL